MYAGGKYFAEISRQYSPSLWEGRAVRSGEGETGDHHVKPGGTWIHPPRSFLETLPEGG
jgi:hypothetical protein